MRIPRLVTIVAVGLGLFDIVRAVAHTIFLGHAASEIAGLDLSGPTGRDQLVLMGAFGASNFITAAALIFVGLTSRAGALLMLAVIPLAYALAGIGTAVWSDGLQGQAAFPGQRNVAVSLAICVASVGATLALQLLSRRDAAAGA